MISSDSVQPFGVDFVDTLTGPDLRTGSELSLDTETVVNDNIISRRDVRRAYRAWTKALVDVSQTYKNDGFDAAEALAGDVIDGAYAYELGAVAFKPTWASGETTFRTSRDGAISYFVGGNDDFDDLGFGIGNKAVQVNGSFHTGDSFGLCAWKARDLALVLKNHPLPLIGLDYEFVVPAGADRGRTRCMIGQGQATGCKPACGR